MKKIFFVINRLVDGFGYWYGAYLLLAGSSILGILSAYSSKGVAWIAKFGLFGLLFSGFAGALLFSIILIALSGVYFIWIKASIARAYSKNITEFNPLDRIIDNKRFRIQDLVSPIDRRINRKRISNCELLGPANIYMHKSVEFVGNEFFECIFIMLRPIEGGIVNTGHAIILDDVVIRESKIYGATIMVPPALVPMLLEAGATFATLIEGDIPK
ncbi:hypothetical protein [Pseudooceanicola sp. HF7]|uniref:hypothetical protein n=1 Tax=Pseudooceanicola sp. HF7 TaxID=2721560 RepID=UPI00143009BC|nr:hypothetical protein [Pseudooceanicola sp. HF7]NIZ09987.1 hypothetical protein [Pseudooceanicola sp. HF7]